MSIVYLIHAKGTDLYKIGLTSGDPEQRLNQLQTASPHELRLVATCFARDSSATVEQYLHYQFEHCRVRGEWFELTGDEPARVMSRMREIETGAAMDEALSHVHKAFLGCRENSVPWEVIQMLASMREMLMGKVRPTEHEESFATFYRFCRENSIGDFFSATPPSHDQHDEEA